MIKKILSLLVIFALLLGAPQPTHAADETCGGEAICPAPAGQCINGGPWPIGQEVTRSQKYCHCSKSNASCTVNGLECNAYSPNDPYAPRTSDGRIDDYCICETADRPFCDVTWWTSCCSPGKPPPEGDGGGDGGDGDGNPTNPPGSTSFISGRIQLDEDANSSGAFCAQNTLSPIDTTGWQVALYNPSSPNTTYPVSTLNDQFNINTTSAGGSYTLTLNLTNQVSGTNYVCSCPAPIDPANPYLCQYVGVSSPNSNVNFYLKEHNLSNDSWFQVFGGNYFGRHGIASSVPHFFCSSDANCQAALSVPMAGSSNQNSSGFPIVNVSDANSILSTNIVGFSHAYLHLDQRINNLNSYAVSTDINQLSYTYFHKLAEKDLQEIGNGEDLNHELVGVGIEVKYTEREYKMGQSEAGRVSDRESTYWVTTRESGQFVGCGSDQLADDDIRQIWRNHLLGLAMVRNNDIARFVSVILYPSGNKHVSRALKKYQSRLVPDAQKSVRGCTYEQYIDCLRRSC